MQGCLGNVHCGDNLRMALWGYSAEVIAGIFGGWARHDIWWLGNWILQGYLVDRYCRDIS